MYDIDFWSSIAAGLVAIWVFRDHWRVKDDD